MNIVLAAASASAMVFNPAPAALDHGVYSCFTSELRTWAGPNAGVAQRVRSGQFELQINTETGLGSVHEHGQTLAEGDRYDIQMRPDGAAQIIARRLDGKFTIRIELDAQPMHFAGLGPVAFLAGTCNRKMEPTE